jgi:ABC-type bacteriocin/lantibiotic exporter with double-glycine peptidase domain
MNKHNAQVVIISSLDWCIRYFKSDYPHQSWSTWSSHLYWGHFHEDLTPPFILKRLDGEYCLCQKLDERDITVIHPTEGALAYDKTSVTHFFYNEVIAYQTNIAFQLKQALVKQIIHQLLRYLWQHPKQMLSMLFIALAYEVLSFSQRL